MSLEMSRGAGRRARIRESLPTVHPGVLDDIAALIDTFPAVQDLGSDEVVGSMTHLARLHSRVGALLTACAGEADSRKLGQVYAAGTAGSLVAIATSGNPAAGSGMVATARGLRTLPHVAQAYAEGRLSHGQVTAFTHASPRITGFGELEEGLVALACEIEPAETRRILDLLISQCTPDSLDQDLAGQRDKRGLSLSELPNGLFRLDGYLDSVEGRRLRDALLAFSDRAGANDPRDAKQRRADALADLVSVAQANTRPLGVSGLTVLIDLDDLPDGVRAQFDDGGLLGPATFDRLSCTVALSCLFGVKRPGGFVPLQLARTARRASAAQWAALIARDRGCIRCGKPPRSCEAHHIVHWKDGGFTDLPNLVLMCSRCHHDLHAGLYTVTMGTDGMPVVTVNRGPPARLG